MTQTDSPPLDPGPFAAALPARGRLMALDLGGKTIGIALSDTERRLATPHALIRRGKFSQDAASLAALAAEHAACGLVLGYPLNMDGSSGPRCQSTRQFLRSLLPLLPLPALLWDERQTSQMAEEMLAQRGANTRQKGEWVDKLAAAAILQSCLDHLQRIA